MLLPPQQKSVELIKTLLKKYIQHGDLVFAPFSRSYSTGPACMLLPEHLLCIVGDNEHDLEAHYMAQWVEVFATQILNDESDIPGTPELVQTAQLFTQEV